MTEEPGFDDGFTFDGSEYDLRQGKLQSLGDFVDRLNKVHTFALSGDDGQGNNKGRYRRFMWAVLRILYSEAQNHSKNDELIQEIDTLFEENSIRRADIEDLEEIRFKVQELMTDANLDLPRKKKLNPDKAWRDGL